VMIRMDAKKFNVQIYPNPVSTQIRASIELLRKERVTVTLLDMNGKKMIERSYNLNAGNNLIEMDNLNRIPPGVYSLRVITAQEQQVVKVIRE
jgi:hypothetical protein